MSKTKTIIAAVVAAALACACIKDAEMVERIELGCAESSLEVSSEAGSHTFSILCSGDFEASIADDSPWLSFRGASSRSINCSGDSDVEVEFEANTGDERKAVLTLKSGRRSLELSLIQNAASQKTFYFPRHNMLIGFETGAHSIPFVCGVDPSTVSYSVTYEGTQKGWIEEPVSGLIAGDFVFAAKENLAAERRGAIVTLSAPDAVGRTMKAYLYVSQMASTEVETIPVTVADVRRFTVDDLDGDGLIRKNYVLKARVVNDNREGNGAANRNVSIIQQDRTLSSRTVYLQSLEPDSSGQYCGIQLQFSTVEDNSTERYDLLEINLKGLKFQSLGTPGGKIPFHVVLSGAGVVNIISTASGTAADLPKIIRTMDSLSDDDIYTFVTIPEAEIPIRKGPFCPVDLRYTNIVNKYPMVLRDAAGNIMYLISNTFCNWARDGRGLPEGSGPVSGVIVHEGCDNFEWNSAEVLTNPLLPDYVTDVGYIGKYQIRPILREEIGISSSLEDGLSELVAEWRYANSLYPDHITVNERNDTIRPTYPVSQDPLADPALKGYMTYKGGTLAKGQDWTHLGPVVNGVITDLPGGNGVFDAQGRSIHWNPISYVSTTGLIQGQNCSSWHGGNWYSGDPSNPKLDQYHWEIAFSTEGLDASRAPLSVNLGVSNAYGDDTGAPRYWTLAYSTDGSSWTEVNASSYSSESWRDDTAKGTDYTYTIPDFPLIASKKQYNLPGNKYVSVNLPSSADIWGKEMVYVRLYPAKNLSGSNLSAAVSYDSAAITNNRRSCINYVGIRCKK